MRLLLLALLAVPPAAFADGAVLLFPAIGTPRKVTLSGRVFKDQPTKGSSTLSKNLRRLMAQNWEDVPVEVHYGGLTKNVVSGHDGNFEAVFESEKGFAVGTAPSDAVVKGAATGTAWVEILSATAPYFVVSDFDDTIAVSEVLSKRRLIANALLKDEKSQQVVAGMPEFYGCLRETRGAPSFALVSGSPIQFGLRIGAFVTAHKFPPIGLYLRDIGPDTLTGYKQPIIRRLMQQMPNQVVLIGDSGEHDPEVYADMKKEFPDRVRAVYIRTAGRTDDPKRFEGMLLFDDPKTAAADAVTKGLASKECVAKAFP
jgi:phosphatidate phosphatase APP1